MTKKTDDEITVRGNALPEAPEGYLWVPASEVGGKADCKEDWSIIETNDDQDYKDGHYRVVGKLMRHENGKQWNTWSKFKDEDGDTQARFVHREEAALWVVSGPRLAAEQKPRIRAARSMPPLAHLANYTDLQQQCRWATAFSIVALIEATVALVLHFVK